MALVKVIEEAGQSTGHHLMVVVVVDELVPGATDTFAAEQGASGEAAEDLKNNSVCEAGQCVLLVAGHFHLVRVQ
jgi:hypothetical protein